MVDTNAVSPMGGTSASDEDALVHRDLVAHHVAQARFGLPANLAAAGLVSVVVWPLADRASLVAWLATMVLTQIVYAVNDRFVRRDGARLFAAPAILPVVGTLWGMGLFIVRDDQLVTAAGSMMLVFVSAVAAASVVTLAAFRRLFVLFCSPMLIMTAAAYLVHGTGVFRVLIPLGAALMAALFASYNHAASTALTDAVRFRHRAALVARQREYEATHDALTGLVNRGGLFELSGTVAANARAAGRGYAFVFIDVDDFKRINDENSHAVGDAVLRDLAARVRAVCRANEVPARLGGDEFVVLVDGVATLDEAAEVGERICNAVREPIVVEGATLVVSMSVGIAHSPGAADEPTDLLNASDRAMYQAKGDAGVRVVVYDEELRRRAEEQVRLERELRVSVEGDGIVAHAQPIVTLATGEVTAVELLARWARPGHGIVPAALFIDAAERTGLVVDISRRLLHIAGELATRWRSDPALAGVRIAVNVAARHLRHGGLLDDVRVVLNAHPELRDRLVLELTETEMLENLDDAVAALGALSALGAVVAIDDFGQGYSSLAYLQRLPAQLVKIDRQFVAALSSDAGSRAVVSAAVGLAEAFGRETVAEGIERADDAIVAEQLGCRYGQGYWFARPLPLGDIEVYVRQRAFTPSRTRHENASSVTASVDAANASSTADSNASAPMSASVSPARRSPW